MFLVSDKASRVFTVQTTVLQQWIIKNVISHSWDCVVDTTKHDEHNFQKTIPDSSHDTTENDRKDSASLHVSTFMWIIYMLVQRQRPQDKNLPAPLCMWVSCFTATIAQAVGEPPALQKGRERR